MPKVICLNCNSTFSAYQKEINRGFGKFCSRSCSWSYKRPSKAKILTIVCAYCGTDSKVLFSSRRTSRSGLHFCNRTCKDLAQRISEKQVEEIQPDHYGTSDGSRTYRKKALQKFPKRCNRCGYCECEGILRVHHKDHNRSHNDLSNLEILCPNCHVLEHYLHRDLI